MITRIIMDSDVATVGKTYLKGQVYDSRVPADVPVAITGFLIGYFIAKGWAHEQTWSEWFATIDVRCKVREAA